MTQNSTLSFLSNIGSFQFSLAVTIVICLFFIYQTIFFGRSFESFIEYDSIIKNKDDFLTYASLIQKNINMADGDLYVDISYNDPMTESNYFKLLSNQDLYDYSMNDSHMFNWDEETMKLYRAFLSEQRAFFNDVSFRNYTNKLRKIYNQTMIINIMNNYSGHNKSLNSNINIEGFTNRPKRFYKKVIQNMRQHRRRQEKRRRKREEKRRKRHIQHFQKIQQDGVIKQFIKGIIYGGSNLLTPFKSFREQTFKDSESIIKCKDGKLHKYLINDADGNKKLIDDGNILPINMGGLSMRAKKGKDINQCNPCGVNKDDCHYHINFEENGGLLPDDNLQMNLKKYIF